ncbi:MAG: 16S rRNA (adenine(1518)-N(6)/adenine(1519)-N(6))-dimethyltransferase RsmA [Bacteroidota bacterium]|nr:16S rRNA (adenine(1518)-N(6)/adenine(1519)-N(6))-dimethyltransferase RsmA [Bacteroidota bacterium]
MPSLRSHEHLHPRKSLGQHFLRDANIAHKIVAALSVQNQNLVLEIGPGEGALTSLLLATPARYIIAVEYDTRAVAFLHTRFADEIAQGRLHIVQSDILRCSFQNLLPTRLSTDQSFSIVGNIPYYITSDILFWIFEQWALQYVDTCCHAHQETPYLCKAVLMMQREVAERIIAQPRTKAYGILSIASSLVSTPAVLFDVSPQCFFPPPRVRSSVVSFQMRHTKEAAQHFRAVHPLVRIAFNQRRKILANALARIIPKQRLAELATTEEIQKISYFRSRPEELTPYDFIRLHELLQEFRFVSNVVPMQNDRCQRA